MQTDPLPADRDSLPLMPVRRLHNYLYCPRLFYLQWVENLFEENADTAAGSAAHRQTDQPSRFDDEKAEALRTGLPEGSRLRSLKIESVTLGLVGVIDVVEGGADGLELVDYKKGSALRTENGTLVPKQNDSAQLAAYALLLAEDGARVASASVFYAADRRRVPVVLDDTLFDLVRSTVDAARTLAASGRMPPPLVDDIRCLHCSAYALCLPRESAWWRQVRPSPARSHTPTLPGFEDTDPGIREIPPPPELADQPPRPPRLDGELLVVQTPGAMVGQSGGEFTVSVKKEVLRKIRPCPNLPKLPLLRNNRNKGVAQIISAFERIDADFARSTHSLERSVEALSSHPQTAPTLNKEAP